MLILNKIQIITIDILYWMPDHPHILQQFVWQTEDQIPEYLRAKKFLNYWKNNIDAKIHQICIAQNEKYLSQKFTSIDDFIKL